MRPEIRHRITAEPRVAMVPPASCTDVQTALTLLGKYQKLGGPGVDMAALSASAVAH
jgi:hypothetical protein